MHNNPDFMMTMSPQIRRGRNEIELNTEDTTIDHSGTFGTTNPATNYHSHAKISGRSHGKKHSVDPGHIPHHTHQMSAVIPDQYELPGVKGALGNKQSKKTF